MEQLPKIVAQRLQAVSPTGAHPDANLLAAFAEKSLLPREQAQILEHLAGCVECREVVAHAQPDQVLQGTAAPIAARRSWWFSGATIRWAALAACVVVVGAVVISRTQFTRKPESIATYVSKSDIAIKRVPQAQPVPPSRPSEEKDTALEKPSRLKTEPEVDTKRDLDRLSEFKKQPAANTVVNGAFGERRQTDKSVGDVVVENNSPLSSAETVTVTTEATPVVAQPKNEDAKSNKREFSADKAMRASAGINEIAQAQAAPAPAPPPPVAKPALEDSEVTRAKESEQSYYKQKDGYVSGGAIGGLAKMRAVIPMWQISEDGKLIKSLDHGQNWQPVPVGDKTIFRALCVTGVEIWVGGSQGSLFYSSDLGQQWEQVKPMAKGQTLTADITAIEFKDAKHGKVTTANHQTWTTNDGGHDWKVESR